MLHLLIEEPTEIFSVEAWQEYLATLRDEMPDDQEEKALLIRLAERRIASLIELHRQMAEEKAA
ncbi:MAG: hypothetical protein LBI31_02735 [Zoogloeaceae bacterium]|jgi:hypothetical protein|nr:hypothetical protein [Zoogloeaceae bacterium]